MEARGGRTGGFAISGRCGWESRGRHAALAKIRDLARGVHPEQRVRKRLQDATQFRIGLKQFAGTEVERAFQHSPAGVEFIVSVADGREEAVPAGGNLRIDTRVPFQLALEEAVKTYHHSLQTSASVVIASDSLCSSDASPGASGAISPHE